MFHRDRGTLYKEFGIEPRTGRAERILELGEVQWLAAGAGDARMLI